MAGLDNNRPLSVSAYPIAWRVEVVNDALYHGCEYVRLEYEVTSSLQEWLTDFACQHLLGNHGHSLGCIEA